MDWTAAISPLTITGPPESPLMALGLLWRIAAEVTKVRRLRPTAMGDRAMTRPTRCPGRRRPPPKPSVTVGARKGAGEVDKRSRSFGGDGVSRRRTAMSVRGMRTAPRTFVGNHAPSTKIGPLRPRRKWAQLRTRSVRAWTAASRSGLMSTPEQ